MPLFDLAPQLNSMCNLKSPNFAVVTISELSPLLPRVPSSIVQVSLGNLASLLQNLHPVKSLPLNNVIGLPHFGMVLEFIAGAFFATQCHDAPLEPVTVPTSRPPP